MKMTWLAALPLLVCLTKGFAQSPAEAPSTRKFEQLPGSDRDAHDCIPSAGYLWCDAMKRCERPWELAKEKKFSDTAEAFDKFCANAPKKEHKQK